MRSMIVISIVAIGTVTAVGVRASQDKNSTSVVRAHVEFANAQQAGQAQTTPPPAGRGRGPQQPPKNLQVLPKDWTTQQVQQVMQTFKSGLGVECTYCHVADRSSDEMKTKVTARKMIQMAMAINDTYLKDVGEPAAPGTQKVTCYTCHRGTTKPLTAAPAGGGHF